MSIVGPRPHMVEHDSITIRIYLEIFLKDTNAILVLRVGTSKWFERHLVQKSWKEEWNLTYGI